jgi:competence protein ComEC
MSRVDVLALTHAHADHMGGMPVVMANCWPREFWLPQGIPDDEIRELLSEAHELGSRLSIAMLETLAPMAER